MSDLDVAGTSDAQNGGAVDPKSTLSYKLAKYAVIILSVLILIALSLLAVGVARNLSGKKSETAAPASASAANDAANAEPTIMTLVPGASIQQVQVQGERLIISVQTPAGTEVDIIDTKNGKLVAQIRPGGAPAQQQPQQ